MGVTGREDPDDRADRKATDFPDLVTRTGASSYCSAPHRPWYPYCNPPAPGALRAAIRLLIPVSDGSLPSVGSATGLGVVKERDPCIPAWLHYTFRYF